MANSKLKLINTLSSSQFTWIHLKKNSPKAIKYLEKNFNFHKLDLKDCAPPLQRPKIIDHYNYIFMILLFPYYDRKDKTIKASEIDFFIGKDYLITVSSDENIPVIEKFFLKLKNDKILKQEYFGENPVNILIDLIYKLYNYCFPILNHLHLDTQKIEDQLFKAENNTVLIKDILKIKNNIIAFHRTIRAHKNVIKRMNRYLPSYFLLTNKQIDYLNNLVEYTKDIWDDIDNYKDTINALYETYSSLIAYKSNQIIKTLTIVSTLLLPLSVIGTIFGMNTVESMPFINNPLGFWLVLLLMTGTTLILLIIFKVKKWFD